MFVKDFPLKLKQNKNSPAFNTICKIMCIYISYVDDEVTLGKKRHIELPARYLEKDFRKFHC